MKKNILIGAAFLIACSIGFAQTSNNTENVEKVYSDLLTSAIENNYEIQIQKIALKNALGQYYIAKGVTDYNLGADAGYSLQNEPYDVDAGKDYDVIRARGFNSSVYLQKLFSFGLNTKLSYSMKNQWGETHYVNPSYTEKSLAVNQGSIALELELPLFKSFNNSIAKNQIEKAKLYLDSLQYSLEDNVSQLIIKVSKTYFEYILQQASLDQLRKVKANLEEQMKGMDSLIQAGVRSKNDLLEMTVNLEEYNSAILTKEAELTQIVSELYLLTGVEIENIEKGVPDFDVVRESINDSLSKENVELSDEDISKVVLNSSDVVALKYQLDSAKSSYKIAQAKGMPDFNLNFSLGTAGTVYSDKFYDYFASPYKNVRGPNVGGSLSFKMGLERFDAKGLIESANAEIAKAQLDYSNQIKVKTQNLKNTILLLNKYREFSLKANATLDMNEELHDNQIKRFKAGLITVNELYSQDEKLLNANSNFTKTLTTYYIQILYYKYYTNNLVNLTNDKLNSVSTQIFTQE